MIQEMVSFKTKSDVSDMEVLMAAARSQQVIQHYAGFKRRQLLRMEDHWLDLVIWESLGEAQAAASQAMKNPECLAFFNLIDEHSIDLKYATIVKEW